ncbi:MAG: integrin [Acidobacteria bacterium]|nr:integrin [Acidobacteriota bacterium]
MNRQTRERRVRDAIACALFVIGGGHAFSQGSTRQTEAPALPLKQVAYIKASNAEAYDYFGDGGGNQGHNGNSIAVSGDGGTMAVGAPYESGGSRGINGNQTDNAAYASGAVYVFARRDGGWLQQAYIKASNTDQSDHFGAAVALSRDGNTLAVAAPWESSAATGVNGNQNDNSLRQAGAVYIFARSGRTWTQQAFLKASNTGRAGEGGAPGDGDQFGYSVALSGDGNTLAAGAISEDSAAQDVNGNQQDDSQQSAGAVYVFTRAGTAWTQQAYFKGSHLQAGDMLGFAVALSFDGSTLVTSAFDERGSGRTINGPRDNTAGGAGALYVFARRAGAWTQEAYIKGSRTEATDQLGYAVAISDDGNTVAAGAGDEDCLTPGVNPPGCDNDSPPRGAANIWVGAAYVFVRSGTTWTEQAFIKASNPRPYSSFGVRLALSGDGNTLAVTAYLEDSAGQGVRAPERQPLLIVDHLDPWREHRNQAEESGAAYVYTRTGTAWTARAYVKGSNTEAGDEFGSAVALSGDGRLMAVGAHNEDGGARGTDGGSQADNSAEDSGAVYVFAY